MGPSGTYNLATIHAWVGEEEQALDQIEHLLSIPGGTSIHDYRLDPRFQALLEKDGREAE